jgi:hypothetical protein
VLAQPPAAHKEGWWGHSGQSLPSWSLFQFLFLSGAASDRLGSSSCPQTEKGRWKLGVG